MRKALSTNRNILCHTLAACCGLTIAILLGLLLDRRDPIELFQGRITPYYVHEGDNVVLTWPLIEHRSCNGELRRRLVDSGNKIHEFTSEPTVYHERLDTEKKTFVKNFTIPYGVAPGPAVYYTVGTRWCNIVQKLIWPIAFRSPNIQLCVLPNDENEHPGACSDLLKSKQSNLSRNLRLWRLPY